MRILRRLIAMVFDQTGDSYAQVRVNRTRYWDFPIWFEIEGY